MFSLFSARKDQVKYFLNIRPSLWSFAKNARKQPNVSSYRAIYIKPWAKKKQQIFSCQGKANKILVYSYPLQIRSPKSSSRLTNSIKRISLSVNLNLMTKHRFNTDSECLLCIWTTFNCLYIFNNLSFLPVIPQISLPTTKSANNNKLYCTYQKCFRYVSRRFQLAAGNNKIDENAREPD